MTNKRAIALIGCSVLAAAVMHAAEPSKRLSENPYGIPDQQQSSSEAYNNSSLSNNRIKTTVHPCQICFKAGNVFILNQRQLC